MEKTKLIFVTNYFGNGGAATVMKIIIEDLIKTEKYNIEIISFDQKNKFDDTKNRYEIPKNVKFTVLQIDSNSKIGERFGRTIKLRKIFNKNKNSIIISFEYFVNMQVIVSNMFLKNKVIVSERNDPNRSGNKKKHLRNFLYGFADKLVCQTPDAKAYFPKKIQEKTVIIPNPVRTDLPNRFEEERNKNIVTFCRVTKQKNLVMMINVFEKVLKEYPEYKLIIYGDGPEKETLINYVKKKKIDKKVIFHDFKKNLHNEIIDASMFLSSSDFEGISNSMLEAMAIGLPTICTDCPCGGARMMIENNVNGILVPVGNEEAMYKAIKKVIENQDFAEKLSKNAIKINDRLHPRKICKMWIDLI